jgi:signal transduction histidine kinase
MNRRSAVSTRARRPRPTVRLRWSLLWGGLFVLAGAALLSLNYVLVEQSLNQNRDEVRAAIARRLGVSEGELRDAFDPPPPTGTDAPPLPPGGPSLFQDVQADVTRAHLDRLIVQSAIALGVMALVSLGLGWVLAGRLLRPINEMTATARRLSDTNLHERIALSGPKDELKELADTFDAMLDRLESAFESQRRFVADASHELRTPLSIIRAEVDVALASPDVSVAEYRAMGEIVRDATGRSERLLDSLLALARSDAADRGTDDCDLADLADIAVERVARDADELGLGLTLALAPAPVTGDRVLLERLVGNLIENAVRHNEPKGWLSVETKVTNRAARLTVENGGPVIAHADAAKLTRRFHSSNTNEHEPRGFGLGLSIVDSVTRAMGGSLELVSRDRGGLRVCISLPARSTRDIRTPQSVSS